MLQGGDVINNEVVFYYTNEDQLGDLAVPNILRRHGHSVVVGHDNPSLEFLKEHNVSFVISDRARYLIKKPVIEGMQGRIINLHPSYLPWCKGYHPILGGVIENRCLGATIHLIDETIDTGDILLQEVIDVYVDDTLRTLYERHRHCLVRMLEKNLAALLSQSIQPRKQHPHLGNLNYRYQFEEIIASLPSSWDTSVSWIRENIHSL